MGYPMTFRRVVNRSSLADGDYNSAPRRHAHGMALSFTEATVASEDETKIARAPYMAERLGEYEKAFRLLAGDLRRLEHDAVDEDGVCDLVAARTGIDRDVVAAVLKEFMSL